MRKIINKFVRPVINKLGIEITRHSKYPADFTKKDIKIWEEVKPYTMTSQERVNVLIESVKYIVGNNIQGAMVECGVWKGGSAMTMASALKEIGDEKRDLFLYDTFSGMTMPAEVDVSSRWGKASDIFAKTSISDDESDWCRSSLEEVKNNIALTSYPESQIHYIQGKVEDTIPEIMPKKIALLRLDTDWYKSTKHELTYLFPLLSKGGILIIDDYGCWEGAKKAVDEYIFENNLRLFLVRVDSSARIGVKN